MKNDSYKNVVVIGGGTGSFAVLSGLKHHDIDLTALVSMVDDGGSTGVLRDELGVLPPGDVRQCLVALSDSSQELRDLFNFRFDEGTFAGHSFGNLFLSTVEKMTNDFGSAVRIAGNILNIHGRVVPITLDDVRLSVTWDDGSSIRGQAQIAAAQFEKQKGKPRVMLDPTPRINPEAQTPIERADLIIMAPGDLYDSLAPPLIVPGVSEALVHSRATKVYICNLVTKPGHTDGFTVQDHADEIERFVGAHVLDYVLYNTDSPHQDVLERYLREGELLVTLGTQTPNGHYKVIGDGLLGTQEVAPASGDKLAWRRSLIRHDSEKLASSVLLLDKQ